MNVLSRFYTYDKQEVLVIKEGSSFYILANSIKIGPYAHLQQAEDKAEDLVYGVEHNANLSIPR